ncbi:MAG TPA: hypothetical protein VE242_03265 [Chthoniobacterales bacterium]|nr:hypothetical protein [Chthoniobacterales bacterium]
MENRPTPHINGRPKVCVPSQKRNFTKHLVGIWRDLEDNPRWKYEELPPVQLLEKWQLDRHRVDKDELERVQYFWSCRPRFLRLISYAAWLIIALGVPFWLFIVPAIGVPLLTVTAVLVNTDIVRSVRWRRQYELTIDRLIRTKSVPPRLSDSNNQTA